MNDDFPTFERPAIAISGRPGGGSWPGRPAAVSKRAELTRTRRSAARRRRRIDAQRAPQDAHLDRELLAERALLQRFDDHRRLVLRLLREVDDRALPVRRRRELVLGRDVGELEVDRLRRELLVL